MHEGGGRWVGSNKVVELKKKKRVVYSNCDKSKNIELLQKFQ